MLPEKNTNTSFIKQEKHQSLKKHDISSRTLFSIKDKQNYSGDVHKYKKNIAPKELLHPTGLMFVRAFVTLVEIVCSIYRRRMNPKGWNFAVECN